MRGLLGILCIVLLAWLLSEARRKVAWKQVAAALLLQVVIAVLFIKVEFLQAVLSSLNVIVQALEAATAAGSQFMFGYLAGAAEPFTVTNASANFVIAFRVLPLIMVVSAISAALFHWGVIQKVVGLFSWFLKKTLKIEGPVSFAVAANLYFGIVEAPLLVRPYLEKMSRHQLFVVMSAGMATVAGTVMVLYSSILGSVLPDALGHLLIASIISAPAIILISLIMIPESSRKESEASDVIEIEIESKNSLDALVKGTFEGLQMVFNVAAMIIVLFTLIHLLNQILAVIPFMNGMKVEELIGFVFKPLLWTMGIESHELAVASQLMGVKVTLNEFVAYTQLSQLPITALSEKSRLILIYAMCGFANFASVGLVVGALGSIIPHRRAEIAGLGFKSLVAGVLATCMTGTLIGMVY